MKHLQHLNYDKSFAERFINAVKFDKKDRVLLLRIVDTNGNQFVFYKQEKTKSSTNRAGSEESESDLPSNFPSENSLPQAESENNSFSKKPSYRFDTDYLSAVERGDMKIAQKMVGKAAKRDIVPRAGASPAPATVKETYAMIFKSRRKTPALS